MANGRRDAFDTYGVTVSWDGQSRFIDADEANTTPLLGMAMLNDHGGVKTARLLLDAPTVSDGYTALWERQRLDLTVEAVILDNERFHSLFSNEQLDTCRTRLDQYGYSSSFRAVIDIKFPTSSG